MSIEDLLDALRLYDVQLHYRGGQLVLIGALERLPASLLRRLRECKAEILIQRESLPIQDQNLVIASHGQARLAYLDLLRPRSAAYIVSAALVLRGACDVNALTAAWEHVVQRHEAMRTCLAWRDGQAFARAQKGDIALAPVVVDLRNLPSVDATRRLHLLREKLATIGFDLQQAPLWRCILVLREPEIVELMLAAHHFIADGWSIAHALRELADAYTHLVTGNPWSPPLPTRRYADYVAWQRTVLNSDEGRNALGWWVENLRGYDVPLRLPTDHMRPAALSDRGARVAFSLDATAAVRLREFAASHQGTVSQVLSAAYAVLLHRLSGAARFLIGVAVSNRPEGAYHDVFGFFVNWLPVPVDFSGYPSFEEFFQRFSGARHDALRRQDTPFDEIVHACKPAPRLSHHPLFQHMVVSHVPARRVEFASLRAEIEPLDTRTSKLDLTLFITDCRRALPIADQGDIFLELEYSTDLYEHATIERLGGVLLCVIESALAGPNSPVNQLAFDWPLVRQPTTPPPIIAAGEIRTPSLLSLLAVAARNHATQAAIVQHGKVLRYVDLWARAGAIAAALVDRGVCPGDRVVLLTSRTPDLLAAYIGVLRVGAIVVPMELGQPLGRLQAMLVDSEPMVVLTDAPLSPCLDEVVVPSSVMNLASIGPTDAKSALPEPPNEPSGAYLLYTSGSTGRPKGVLGSHLALANFVQWLNKYLATTPGERVLARAPLTFDASLRETLAPLCAGATVVLADDDTQADPQALVALMHAERVTVLHVTPTVHRGLLNILCEAGRELPMLRHVMCGGEAISVELARQHYRVLPDARLYNVYGPTECTIDVTVHAVTNDENAIPLGRAIDGAEVYAADCNLAVVSAGTVGEIVIGGASLGIGYWREAAGQPSGFVIATKGPCAGQRVYRTGDLGKFGPNGDLWYEGRMDRQTKILGARVEPAEVEAVLLRHPGVADAAVIVVGSSDSADARLVALAVPRSALRISELSEAALHDSLRTVLPTYMWPVRIVLLDTLPHLASGKRDWNSLYVLAQQHLNMTEEHASHAMSALELEIAHLMATLVEKPVVSNTVDFFRAGGHSLNAARLLARIRQHYGVAISLREFFANASVGALAHLVEQHRSDGALITTANSIQDTVQTPVAALRRPRGISG